MEAIETQTVVEVERSEHAGVEGATGVNPNRSRLQAITMRCAELPFRPSIAFGTLNFVRFVSIKAACFKRPREDY